MSLQLAKLILYNRDGEVKELPFRTGALNILTGASKTGKSKCDLPLGGHLRGRQAFA
jgi:hypothetical protein